MIKILYFARLREELNCEKEELKYSDHTLTVEALLSFLRSRGKPWSEALSSNKRIMVAINQEVSPIEAKINKQDEIALFPPVTGG